MAERDVAAPAPVDAPAIVLRRDADTTPFFRFAFGPVRTPVEPGTVRVPLETLGGTASSETWLAGPVTHRERRGDLGVVATARDALVHVARPVAGDVADAAGRAYGDLLACVHDLGYPHVVRAWNFVPDINGGTGDEEAYVRFNAGRAAAFARAGLTATRYPAATAVGTSAGSPLVVALLASREEPLAVENPLQTSAYEYPRRYGPRPPTFARAMLVPDGRGATLLVSGTASIVGSESRHRALPEQLGQLLVNLQALAARALAAGPGYAPGPACAFRVYLRSPAEPDAIGAQLRGAFPGCGALAVVRADICRRELVVEAEGVFRLEGRRA